MTAWSEQITANGGWFPFYGPRSNTSGRAARGWAAADAGFPSKPTAGFQRFIHKTSRGGEGQTADCAQGWENG
jgi:hypothetical protein